MWAQAKTLSSASIGTSNLDSLPYPELHTVRPTEAREDLTPAHVFRAGTRAGFGRKPLRRVLFDQPTG